MLVVDLDPQGFLTRMLGADEPPPEHSALALIHPEGDLRQIPVQRMSGFDLVGSSMALTRALRKLTKPTDVLWLRETIAAGHDYDLVLFDTAAALSVFTMNALVASDHLVIPVTPEYQPVVGAEQTWKTAALVKSKLNPVLQPPRLLLTQVDARLSRHAKYSAYLRGKYGTAVTETEIRTSSSLAVASRDGRTVFDARVTTRGAEDYEAAARELGRSVLDAEPVPQGPLDTAVPVPDEIAGAPVPADTDADPAVRAALLGGEEPDSTDAPGGAPRPSSATDPSPASGPSRPAGPAPTISVVRPTEEPAPDADEPRSPVAWSPLDRL